jgi:leucyl-tRNA synthetase
MGEYNFRELEKKWQRHWQQSNIYKVSEDTSKPKYYVLDMFPYPSGAGLHVGHPLGYIASDIIARFKRLQGFNVLHPMGFDAFGLPAEQYAFDHGVHPALSTEKNIRTFKSQLNNIGFSYDWSREVQTCDPDFYKWTQWIFLQLFDSYYNRKNNRAERINGLEVVFENEGNAEYPSPADPEFIFTAEDWHEYSFERRQEILMNYRIAFLSHAEVWWCEALGTVLANDEVVNGVSERGGHPVVKKRMRQWFLRITEYAERLLDGLEMVDFSESLKEMQRNWIGKSYGCEITFPVENRGIGIKVYTTRPDTIFGADFVVLAPEHELVSDITTYECKEAVEQYLIYVKSRSELERVSDINQITGCFTGTLATNPVSGKQVPVWVAEYILAGYGTGAIMAVPCGDQRDFAFARHFKIPVTNILGDSFDGKEANESTEAIIRDSGFISNMSALEAKETMILWIESKNLGRRKTNFRMRDAGFSRQRYWGEPFPIVFKGDTAVPLSEDILPLELPELESFSSGPDGQGPLANLKEWVKLPDGTYRETNTMPGYAGSSWYFLRYMDPHNDNEFCARKFSDYWNQVDLYVGGSEHAVGHLLYSRLWTKVLFDLGHIGFDEPFKKLINQGMIQGVSSFVYRLAVQQNTFEDAMQKADEVTNIYVSDGIVADFYSKKINKIEINNLLEKQFGSKYAELAITDAEGIGFLRMRVDISFVTNNELNTTALKRSRPEFKDADFVLENGKYICGSQVEKMSKSKFNVINPDDVIDKYGADSLRLYEMFLGPIEDSKPWNIHGIDGVHRFLRKVWKLLVNPDGTSRTTDTAPTPENLKILHQTIKKVTEDMERYSFNTSVSSFMICVNTLTEQRCTCKSVMRDFIILISPFAPHIAEELWSRLGEKSSVIQTLWPVFNPAYLIGDSKTYPVSINGKRRVQLEFSLDMPIPEIEKAVLTNAIVQRWLDGKTPKKIIVVKGKIINVVV